MKHKPCIPLGNGATMVQEASHYIHHVGNQLMVLIMRMEIRQTASKERRKAFHANRRRLRRRKK